MSYAFKEYKNDSMARALGRSLPISAKKAIEICNVIRGKKVSFGKSFLNKVMKLEEPVPFKRFNRDVGHKKVVGPGRFPVKTAGEILKILESAETNAQFKGLNTSNLIIKAIITNRSAKSWRYGRQRRRVMKRSSVEVVVEEMAAKNEEKKKVEKKKK